MTGLMRSHKLRVRIMIWAEKEIRAGASLTKSGIVLKAAIYQGVLQQGDWRSAGLVFMRSYCPRPQRRADHRRDRALQQGAGRPPYRIDTSALPRERSPEPERCAGETRWG